VPDLIEPVCQASIVSHSSGVLLFSNPASHDRTCMTVKLSQDEGRTWPTGVVVYAGPSAYSCLATLVGGTILCLYENGVDSPYERISLARLTVRELVVGRVEAAGEGAGVAQ